MKRFFNSALLLGMMLLGQTILLKGQQKVDPGTSGQNIITVGLANADIVGSDNRAIQAAIDMMAARGGGTVHILSGEYILDDALRLRSNIRLTGDGLNNTILKHAPSISSPLLKDADTGQKEATPIDVSRFKVGMGIVFRSNKYQNEMVTKPFTITRIENGVLYFNNYIEFDFIADFEGSKGEEGGLVANIYPLIFGYEIENATVEGLTVDATVADDPGWVDVRSGNLVLDRCKSCNIHNVKAVNTRGDGILIITSEHITVEDCEGANNTHHGIHSGSHSPWTVVRRCIVHDNGSDGIYICWGVRESEFTDNTVYHNGFGLIRNGISIGHKDTDDLLARNHIYDNAKDGIHFRTKTEPNGPHRTKVIDNLIENNGLAGPKVKGSGIHICGIVHDIIIENNTIRETREGAGRLQMNAVFIEQGVSRVKMSNNKISGHPESAIVDNSKSPDNQLQIDLYSVDPKK